VICSDPREAVNHFLNAISGPTPPRFVAVGGPTAVGKSTLSRQFHEGARSTGVSAFVLEGDRFLVPQIERPHPAVFPDDIYEVERLRSAVRAIANGETFEAPFYERDGRHTGRLRIRSKEDADEILEICRARACSAENELSIEIGEVVERVKPTEGVWILDSELSLLYDDFIPHYDLSYGIRASREIRKSHFLEAVRKGERYPFLTETEANAKIEGFWQADDALIEPTVSRAEVVIELQQS